MHTKQEIEVEISVKMYSECNEDFFNSSLDGTRTKTKILSIERRIKKMEENNRIINNLLNINDH